ncbi:MAG: TIGR01212 family radical SAM protein [Planctomycetota bacterium]
MKTSPLEQKTLPYRSYSSYLQEKFGTRVHKITIDAGFTCPNRDGTKAYGGCNYCDNASFSPQVRFQETVSVSEQLKKGMQYVYAMNESTHFIAYFQAFTNTYADLETLKRIYDQCLVPNIVGMAIGTRPDCLSPEIIEFLSSYTRYFPVWLELGLQSIHDETQQNTNRLQTAADFYQAIDWITPTPLELSVHLILGLPGETKEMMFDTIRAVAVEPIHSLKIHHLYIAPHTLLEKQWKAGKIKLFTLEEYISLVVDALELLPPTIVIERLLGELSRKYSLAPQWGLGKNHILQKMVSEFHRRGTSQGSRYQPESSEKFRQRFLKPSSQTLVVPSKPYLIDSDKH